MAVVLCFGDSNTHGVDPATGGRHPAHVRWPGALGRLLGPDVTVIEEGLNGRTTVWDDPFVDGRNGRTYLLPCLRSHMPIDVVVLVVGTNDCKSVFGRRPHEVAHGAMALVDVIQGSLAGPGGAAPAILLVAPPGLGQASDKAALWGFGAAREAVAALGPHYATVARMKGTAFLDGATVATADGGDGVHLGPDGHAALGAAIAREVGRLLGRPPVG